MKIRRDLVIYILFTLAILLLSVGLFYLNSQISLLSVTHVTTPSPIPYIPVPTVKIVTITPKASPTPQSILLSPIPTQIPFKFKQTAFIPLGGSYTTNSTDWKDIPNAQIWLDVNNEYGSKAVVYWEVFLKVLQGNGQAFARLFDVTHSIAVSGSEVNVASSDFTLTSAGPLNLWSGRNLYRVQIKSLNTYDATFDNGRLKIVTTN